MCPRQRLFGHFALSALVGDDIVGAIDLKQELLLKNGPRSATRRAKTSRRERRPSALPQLESPGWRRAQGLSPTDQCVSAISS
jgi:hypothetical protein